MQLQKPQQLMNNSEMVLAVASITLLMLLLVSAIVIVFFISGRQRLKQQMELAQNKLTYEKELRQVETEVSEQILGQLAQELHDNVGQLLTAVHIHLENQKIDHPELKEGFKPMETYLSEVSQQIRLMSRTLNNDYIGHIGLLKAMDVELNRIQSLRRFRVHWQAVSGSSNLDKNQELMIFRVFQEIIQNSLRHSLAKNAYVEVHTDNGGFEMKIKDDGKGFDMESTLQSDKASGLRNILKRAKWAGLDCTINSMPGKGCSIALKKLQISELKI
jgi:two-component system NarL family sensor kinase